MSVYVCTGDIYGIVCMCAYRIYMYIVCMCAVRVRFTCHYIAIYIFIARKTILSLFCRVYQICYIRRGKYICHYFDVYNKIAITVRI